jgi:hypothetical protein
MINKLLIALGIVLASCYAIHLAGPLRLVDDAPLYLAGASDIAAGGPYHEAKMPRGYPTVCPWASWGATGAESSLAPKSARPRCFHSSKSGTK